MLFFRGCLFGFFFFSFPALKSIATICKMQEPLADRFTDAGHSRTEGHGGGSWRILMLMGWADFGSRLRAAFITGLGSLWWSALVKMLLGPCKVMYQSGSDFILAENSSNVIMLSCTKQDLALLLTGQGHKAECCHCTEQTAILYFTGRADSGTWMS